MLKHSGTPSGNQLILSGSTLLHSYLFVSWVLELHPLGSELNLFLQLLTISTLTKNIHLTNWNKPLEHLQKDIYSMSFFHGNGLNNLSLSFPPSPDIYPLWLLRCFILVFVGCVFFDVNRWCLRMSKYHYFDQQTKVKSQVLGIYVCHLSSKMWKISTSWLVNNTVNADH